MLSNTLASLLVASVLSYVAFSATPAEAFTNGLLIPNYICGPATDKLPKTVGAVLTGIVNADSGVLMPTFEFLNKTAVAADATTGQQVAQTIATFHNNINDLKPNTNVIHLKFSANQITPGKAITIDIFTNNFAPVKNNIQEPSADGRYALDGAVIYAVDSTGNKIGSFTGMGTKNRLAPVVGCGTTGQAVVHNSLLYQDGDNFTMTADGDPVDTYLGVQWTAPTTITGNTVTFMGAAVTDLGFGSHSTVIGVAGAAGAPATPNPLPLGPNPKAFAAFAAAAVTGNCALTYPGADPILSAAGLATPWVTDMNCPQAQFPTFIQANIIDPATGALTVYNMLVIDADTEPAVAPTAPKLPAGAIVTLHFATAGTSLTLADENDGKLLTDANCAFSGGADASPLGGFAYCNAANYFAAVKKNVAKLNPALPALGKDKNGAACPTSRSFSIVNQNPSYNVRAPILMTSDGLFAQSTAANKAALTAAGKKPVVVDNGGNNGMLYTLDTLIGCKAYMAPNLADANTLVPSIALDEIQAQQLQAAPVAKVPMNDPGVLLANGATDVTGAKMATYRMGLFQSTASPAATTGLGASFCKDLGNTAPTAINNWKALTTGKASPDKAIGVDMFTFMANRLITTWADLNCQALINKPAPFSCKDAKGADATATPAATCSANAAFTTQSVAAVDAVDALNADAQPDAGTPAAAATAATTSSASTIVVVSASSLVLSSVLSMFMNF